MAATYGYGGEFSSDEDIDRMEQQSELLVQSKFDSFAQVKPSRRQIEEAIDTIRSMPHDQDVTLTDELLAGLLDHFKTQRGPIVDSTRNLYKKIVLRLIRDQQQQQQASNGDTSKESKESKESNGNANNGNTINNNNIISSNLNVASSKRQQHQPAPEVASSDEDEPMPPVTSGQNNTVVEQSAHKRKFDSRVVYDTTRIEPMEIDSETPAVKVAHQVKPNEIISTSSEDDSETEDSDDESSDSEVLDVTPVKLSAQSMAKTTTTPSTVSSAKSSSSSSESSSVKRQLSSLVISKDSSVLESKKKPYTRSQRVATRASSSSQTTKANQAEMSSEKVEGSIGLRKGLPTSTTTTTITTNKSTQTTKSRLRLIVSALAVVLIAFALYFFRSDLTQSTDRIFKRAIKF